MAKADPKKTITAAPAKKQHEELPRYELTEAFYDNLVLHEAGDVIEWEGAPTPSMIPLNEAAEEIHANMIAAYEQRLSRIGQGVGAPLSELPDSLDGKVTVAGFNPHQKRRKPGEALNPFPKRNQEIKGARKIGSQEELLERAIEQKMPKNFNRVGGEKGDTDGNGFASRQQMQQR